VQWTEGAPETARYACEGCGVRWDDATRWRVLRKGKWIATVPMKIGPPASISTIYSPWVRLGDMAANFVAAKRSPETLKTFVNTASARRGRSARRSTSTRCASAPRVGDTAPANVLVVTCGVDVQPDRLEVERIGWDRARTSGPSIIA